VADLVGGRLVRNGFDRLGRRRTILLACLGVAGFNVAFALAHNLWSSYTFQVAYAAANAVASGIVYASTLALFMDLTHPQFAATQFQLYMALENVRDAWGNRVGGRLAERLAATSMFGLGALVEIAPLALLLFLDPRKARRDFAQEAPCPNNSSPTNA